MCRRAQPFILPRTLCYARAGGAPGEPAPGAVRWRYLFGDGCFAEERTPACACAFCALRCRSLAVRPAAARSPLARRSGAAASK